MNMNGLAVLFGLLVIAFGMLNYTRDDIRFFITFLLIICGILAIIIGLTADLEDKP